MRPDNGCRVLLIAGRRGSPEDRREISVLIDRLEARHFSMHVIGGEVEPGWIEAPGLESRWMIPWVTRSIRLPDDEVPELIHVLDPELADAGLALAERWDIPYLLSISDFPQETERLRIGQKLCQRLIVPSEELAEELRMAYRVPGRLLSVIRPGISLGQPKWATNRGAGLVPVVGTAGPLTPGSGFATFLAAARRVLDAGIDAEFVIAGQGEDEVDLRRRAERLRIVDRVTFADRPAAGLNYWNVLDVCCLTSTSPTTGRNLAHALAHGVPSITSDVAGLRELVIPGATGLRVPAEDSQALATAIIQVLSSPELALRLGEAGRSLVARDLEPTREVDELDQLYREVVANTGILGVSQPVVKIFS